MVTSDFSKVVISVNSPEMQDSITFVNGLKTREEKHNMTLEGFFKLQPKSLGTVQILIGMMVLILGIILTTSDYAYPSVLVYSGITYWGSLIYITAGSLSVAAQYKYHLFVVKASLGMNMFSAVTAGLAIVLLSIQLCMSPNVYAENFILRMVGIMLVFTVPQFVISICISAFACKATCNRDSTMVDVAIIKGY